MRGLQERGPVSPVAAGRRARLALVGVVAAVVLAADQVTKSLALDRLADGPVEVVWTLRLRLSFNEGAAFGLGEALGPVLIAMGVAVLAVLVAVGRLAVARAASAVALGLVVGGAVGNLADRLVRGHGGAVVDFIDFQWWPVFNVADIGITVGAGLLVVTARDDER